MREHMGLFRGRRVDNGEWAKGYLSGYGLICQNEPEDTYNATGEYCGQTPYVGFIEVDPETVGECTGLEDKNGKLIFEGDIVVFDNTPYNAYGHRVTGVIVWHKWAWRFKYKEYESTYHYAIGSEDFFGAKSEVLGNIRDNPQLLGGEDA